MSKIGPQTVPNPAVSRPAATSTAASDSPAGASSGGTAVTASKAGGGTPAFIDRFCDDLAQKAFGGDAAAKRETLENALGPALTEHVLEGASSEKLRAMLGDQTASVTPREVLADWSARANEAISSLGWSTSEAEAHFEARLAQGVQLVEQVRTPPAAVRFRGKEISVARPDVLAQLAQFSPEVALLQAASEQKLLTGAQMRAGIERADLPADVRAAALEAASSAADVARIDEAERLMEGGSPGPAAAAGTPDLAAPGSPAGGVEAWRSTLKELASAEDPRQAARRLVEGLVALQPDKAAELMPSLLEALRHEQQLLQPTLVEAALFASPGAAGATGASAPARAPAAAAAAPEPERVTVCGREVPLYQGDRLDGEIPRRRQMIEVPAFQHVFGVVADAVAKDVPTIILGPSGAAKTAAVEHYAAETETPLLRLNGHPKARVEEFFGEWKLDKEGKPFFEPAQFLQRWVNGGVINVDEFNVYPDAIQNVLAELARSYGRGEDKVALRIGGHLVEVKRNEHTRLVMTANPDYGGVNPISDELNEACDVVPVPGIPPEQLVQIVGKSFPDVPQELLLKACQLQWQLDALADSGGFEGQYHLSIRNLLRVAKRFHAHASAEMDPEKLMARECREVYYDGLMSQSDRTKVAEVFGGIAAQGKKAGAPGVFSMSLEETRPAAADYQQVIGPDSVSFHDATLPRGPNTPVPLGQLKLKIGNRDVPVAATPRLKEQIYAVFKAWQNGEAICLKGPRDCGSSVALEAALAMSGWPSTTKDFNSGTDVGLLLGDTTVENDNGVVSTSFVPGLLTTSAQKGGGFIARNMNRAKASVLARLHPVFEEVRSFTLQNGDRVEVSPNFYFASTLRLESGEAEDGLSPAMANRMTHRYDPELTVDERRELLRTAAASWALPVEVADAMVQFESAYRELVFDRRVISGEVGESNLPAPNFERLLRWLSDVADEFKRTPTAPGLREAFIDRALRQYSVYGDEDEAKIAELARAFADGDTKAVEGLLGHK